MNSPRFHSRPRAIALSFLIAFTAFAAAIPTQAPQASSKAGSQQPAAPRQQKPSVTIRSIILAPGRKSATIEIVNQSAKTITAFAYAYDITLTDGQHSKGEKMTDYVGVIAAEEAGLHLPPPPPGQEPIKPGEVHREVFLFGEPGKVADLAVTMEVVVYMDQTSESINQEILDRFIADRTDEVQIHSIAAEAIAAAMQDEHPFNSAHDRLLKMKHNDTGTAEGAFISARENLEGKTFANADEERKNLASLLASHRSYAATFERHAKIVRHR
jgi:hypothetical protein